MSAKGRSIKSGVFVAVNGAFAGVFALKYSTPPQSYSAFRVLRVGSLRPLLATRDFNVTPLMVEDKFDLRPGRTDFPDVEERVALAQEEGRGKGKPLALLSRNTMLSFCECVTGARRLHRAVPVQSDGVPSVRRHRHRIDVLSVQHRQSSCRRALECAFVPDFVVYPCVALQLPFVQILKKSLYFYVKMPKEIHCKSVKYTV